MLLDDPELSHRGPGEEFAIAYARGGPATSLRLRASISDLFPPAKRRPRYTVRHLLKKAVVDTDEVTVYRERAAEVEAGTAAPEWDFHVGVTTVKIRTIRASVPVPAEILTDPAALAAFVDFRLLVRLGTAENEELLNGEDGILNLPGLRRHTPTGTLTERLLSTTALCEWYGGSADGIVLHPDDWWPLVENGLLERLATQGVKVSRTRMIPAGSALVGDFTAAATLLDRKTSTIGLTDGVLTAEIREGLAVHLPGHFVLASLTEG
jgi:capsid protein